jgi:hypothetical protein
MHLIVKRSSYSKFRIRLVFPVCEVSICFCIFMRYQLSLVRLFWIVRLVFGLSGLVQV